MKQTTASSVGDSWESIRSELLTSEERAKTDKKVTALKKALNRNKLKHKIETSRRN